MKKYEKNELAKEILKGLAVGGFVVACFAFPGFAQVASLFAPKNERDEYRVNRAIHRLHNRKLVRIYKIGGNDVVEITHLGKRKVLEYNLADMKLVVPKKWDGWWYIVIFDIPEKRKRGRDAVSFKIKDLGLYSLQLSIFVSPYECRREIDFIGEFFGVRKYIKYIKAKEIEGEAHIKRYFNL
ncbi:MAG: hypothetical protein AAB769_00740 [Patescibacteria group bacterium]